MKKILIIFSIYVLGTVGGFSQNRNETPVKGFKISEMNKKENSGNLEGGLMNDEERNSFKKAIDKYNSKKYKDAITGLDALIQQNPKMVSYYYYLAQAYYENKQYNECAEACSKGLSIDGQENLLHLYRAQANIALGNTATVCEDLKKSATQDQELLKKYCN